MLHHTLGQVIMLIAFALSWFWLSQILDHLPLILLVPAAAVMILITVLISIMFAILIDQGGDRS